MSDESKSITVVFQLTKEEYFEAWALRQKTNRSRYWIDTIIALTTLAAGIFLIASGTSAWWSFLFLAGPALFFLIRFLGPMYLKIQFESDPKYREQQKITFTNKGLQYSTSKVSSNLEWGFYSALLESDSVILLVYSKYQHSIIPKRSFQSAQDLSDFLLISRKKLAK